METIEKNRNYSYMGTSIWFFTLLQQVAKLLKSSLSTFSQYRST